MPEQQPYAPLPTESTANPWCVDGRGTAPESADWEKGPQMLGASLHPIVIAALVEEAPLDRKFVSQKAATLEEEGYPLSVHTDTHGACGCGFAARLDDVLRVVSGESDEIRSRITAVYGANKAGFDSFFTSADTSIEEIVEALDQMVTTVSERTHETLSAEALLTAMTDAGAQMLTLDGDHQERIAYVNLIPNTTFDTHRRAQEGGQAFNLDLWAAVEQCGALGVSPVEAIAYSLGLYVATEMVLVEDAGKDALPVSVNA